MFFAFLTPKKDISGLWALVDSICQPNVLLHPWNEPASRPIVRDILLLFGDVYLASSSQEQFSKAPVLLDRIFKLQYPLPIYELSTRLLSATASFPSLFYGRLAK